MSWSMVPLHVGPYVVYYMGEGRYAIYKEPDPLALNLTWAETLTWLVLGPGG